MSTTAEPAEPAKPATFREAVAEEVRAALARRRVSASALARKLGKSQTYVWRRLSGETAFDTDDLEAIAGILDVTVVDLLPPDARGGSRVTIRYRDMAERPAAEKPDVRPPARDTSPVRLDHNRRPRRPGAPRPPMPIMHSVAA
jgi:transcriptional regulator with XRE-family HTH domain